MAEFVPAATAVFGALTDTIAVAVPSITDPDCAKVDVDVSTVSDFAPKVGDAVIAIPLVDLPTNARLGAAWVSATDTVTITFSSEGGNVTGANKNFRFLYFDCTPASPGTLMTHLAGLVASLRYKPGWAFKIGGPLGSMLCVFATTPDAQHPERERTTQHQFEIPDFDADGRTPVRWLFDCLLLCELHEVGEFFQVAEERPFYPYHQDEGSPYVLVDRSEPTWP